VHQLIETI